MLIKSGLFLFLLAVFQVSARYKNVIPDDTENGINTESAAISSSSSRISGGLWAKPGQFPHHAALRMFKAEGTIGTCGGAIVSRQWILTAARCTAGHVNVVVRVGVLSITDESPENIFETTEWYNFPTFDDSRPTTVQPNDISLLRLQRRLVYSSLIQPIRVQPGSDAYRDYHNEQLTISGHGWVSIQEPTSDVLRWVYLRAISNMNCVRSFPSGYVVNTIICAGYEYFTNRIPCRDDFGGALVHVGSDGIPTLVGIFVFTTSENGLCNLGTPSGYTRPGPYLPWFRQITGLDFENLKEDDEDDTTTITPTNPPTTIIPTTTLTPTTTTDATTTNTTTTTLSTTTTVPTTTTEFGTTTDAATTAIPTTTVISTTTTDAATTIVPINTTDAATTAFPTTTTDADTTIIPTTTPKASTTAIPTTTFLPTPSTTDSYEPEDSTPGDTTTTAQPGDTEDKEEEEDSDSSECNGDDEMGQLLKRLEVNVKVKVALNKYSVKKETGLEVNHHKH